MEKVQVGLISDTHSLLRPAAFQALAGSALIIHAGDIGKPEIIQELETRAPVVAVRGNTDRGEWAQAFPETQAIEVAQQKLFVLHDLKTLELDPVQAGYKVVVSGHSHQPRAEWRAGVFYLNPGSAGPRRFKLPVTVALLWVSPAGVEAEHIELPI